MVAVTEKIVANLVPILVYMGTHSKPSWYFDMVWRSLKNVDS